MGRRRKKTAPADHLVAALLKLSGEERKLISDLIDALQARRLVPPFAVQQGREP